MTLPTCRELIAFLDDYVAGELPAGRREAFESHLSRCPSCTAYLASYRDTIAAAKGAAPKALEDIPAEVLAAILATVATRK